MPHTKEDVRRFWDRAACGEALYLGGGTRKDWQEQARVRYLLEPYLVEFARFEEWAGKRVLEIGVGLGADHERFSEAGADLVGLDLTRRALRRTAERFGQAGRAARLSLADAENLPFGDEVFDGVFSWGVMHHTPDTAKAVDETHRVLRQGGIARIMVYHRLSMVGVMLWLRYALLALRPWRSLDSVYAEHLESPGTKAFSVAEARELFARFSRVKTATCLSHADLLTSAAGQRHRGPALTVARAIWPRRLIRRYLPHWGLCLMIEAVK